MTKVIKWWSSLVCLKMHGCLISYKFDPWAVHMTIDIGRLSKQSLFPAHTSIIFYSIFFKIISLYITTTYYLIWPLLFNGVLNQTADWCGQTLYLFLHSNFFCSYLIITLRFSRIHFMPYINPKFTCNPFS